MKPFIVYVSLALSFVFSMEVCARIDDYYKYGADLRWPYSRADLRNPAAAQAGQRPWLIGKPHGRFEKWKLNNYGFRGPDIAPKKAGQTRIVVVGSSETFGLYEDEGKEWPAVLQRLILERRQDAEVINSANFGVGIRGNIRLLERTLLDLQPDLIILYQHLGDSANFHGDNAKGAGRMDERQRVMRRNITGHLRILRKIKNQIKFIVPASFLEQWRLAQYRRMVKRIRTKGNVRVMEALDPALVEDAREELRQFIEIVQKNHIPLILTSHVKREDEWGLLNAQFNKPAFSFEVIREFQDKTQELVREAAVTYETAFVDLAAKIESDESHMVDNHHFTNEGAQQIAEGLLPEVLRQIDLLRSTERDDG